MSSPQGKVSSITTHFGTNGALSHGSQERSSRGIAHGVSEDGVAPVDAAGDGLRVGVRQQLRGIETQALFGLVGAVDAKSVELPRTHVGEVDVPHRVGPLPEADAMGGLGVPGTGEQTQLDAGGVLGKEREVGAVPVPDGAQRIGLSGPNAHSVRLPRAVRRVARALFAAPRTGR